MFSFFLASIFEIGKLVLRLGVQRVSGTLGVTFQVVAYACLRWHKHAPHPKTMQNHFIGQVKTTMGDCGRWCAPKSPEHAHATTWKLPTLKFTFRFQILMLRRNYTYERTQNPKALSITGLGFYSIPILDNEGFDALQYPCDSSSRS